MGTITIQSIFDKVSQKLFDEDGTRWLPPELLGDYNLLMGLLGAAKPDVFATTAIFQTASGSKQSLSGRDIAVRRATRNMGSGGTTPGNRILVVERYDFDHSWPNWHNDATSNEIKAVVLDKENPRVFYVWPQVVTYIELVKCTLPAVATAATAPFDPSDEYEYAVFCGLMGLARSKNFRGGDMSQATYWQNSMNTLLGLKGASQIKFISSSTVGEQQRQPPQMAG